MNIDGINYHTITELAEARRCSIARIRQILAAEKIKPRLKLGSLYTDTQAAIVRDHHSGGPMSPGERQADLNQDCEAESMLAYWEYRKFTDQGIEV